MCPSETTLAVEARSRRGGSISDFKPAFDVLDADHDGKISKDDLRMFYSGFSSNGADDNIIGSMMSLADLNKDGFVEYDEFECVLDGVGQHKNSSSSTRSSFGVIEDVFKVMDKDGDEKLSFDDLKSFMRWARLETSDDDIKAMIKLATGGGGKDGVTCNDLLKILNLDNSYVIA